MSANQLELQARAKTINLNAGPSPLPVASLLTAASSLLSYPGTPGMGVAEISHRSGAFQKIMTDADADLKTLFQIPDNYRVLWMQGGGFTQFSATVLNLLAWYRLKHQLKPEDEVVGTYCVTGSWSLKAMQEGARMGAGAVPLVDGRKVGGGKFTTIQPVDEWDLSSHKDATRDPAFVYYCDNETVDGVEFPADKTTGGQPFPFDSFSKDVPIVCDMSSNFLSRPVDISKYGIIYAGAQKNLGPAGVTVLIVREDLIVDPDLAVPFGGPIVPCMLSYKNMADSGSMYNTPPTLTIYICALVLRSLLEHPPLPLAPSAHPLSPLSEFASAKSNLVYTLIDNSDGFFVGTAHKGSRSKMNATFRLKGGAAVEKLFVSKAEEAGIKGVSGHRSVGGIRTSLYNAVTLAQVETLVQFMVEFRAMQEAA